MCRDIWITVPPRINGAPSIQVKKICQDAASSNGDARIKRIVRKKNNEMHAFKAQKVADEICNFLSTQYYL